MALTSDTGQTTTQTTTETTTNPKQQKKLKEFKEDIHNVDQALDQLNKKLTDTLGKTAKLVCLLRLDMVADKLDKINPKWAHVIDEIANAIEKSEE